MYVATSVPAMTALSATGFPDILFAIPRRHAPATPVGSRFDSVIQRPAKMLRPLPVSRKDFRLESARGQPQETFLNVGEPGVKFP
jgi:hypothetical protein